MASWDRHFTYVKGRAVSHTACTRDYVCGCGGKLTTRWFDDEPNWRTVCTKDDSHSPDDFITKARAAYNANAEALRRAELKEIASHLPPEIAAMLE